MKLNKKNITGFIPQIKIIFGIICLLIFTALSLSAKGNDNLFIRGEVNKNQPYEGETFVLSYYLYSKSPDIAYANRKGDLFPDKGTPSFFSQVENSGRGRKVEHNGEVFYKFPLESYIVCFDNPGKYKYVSGNFEIGVNSQVVYNDPFWGRRRGYQTEKIILSPKDVEFKVRSLPGKMEDPKVNSIGKYEVGVSIPRGDIIIDQPARAIIVLKGEGIIGEDVLPDYIDAFKGSDVRLKSMSENRKQYFDGKSVRSELILDCEFIPSAKKVKIGEVTFRFFNPETGKYEVASSSPVEIEVKSIVSKMETVDI